MPDGLPPIAGWIATRLPAEVAERYFMPACWDLQADAVTSQRTGMTRVTRGAFVHFGVLRAAIACLPIAWVEWRASRVRGRQSGSRAGASPMLMQDVRFAVRMLRRNPGFTGVAVLALALGIGASTAIFSVVHAVLLRPLAFPDSSRIVDLSETAEGRLTTISPPNLIDWKTGNRSFEAIAPYNTTRITLTGGLEPRVFDAALASPEVFTVLGVPALAGRTFTADEARPGGPRSVILGYGLWQQQFGGDDRVVGRTLTLDGQPHTVAGVMPQGFTFPDEVDLWIPLRLTEQELRPNQRGAHYLSAVARLKRGVSLQQAIQDLAAIENRIAAQFESVQGYGVWVRPLLDSMVGSVRRPLLMLLGAVGFVLLIACANVANLLLARAATRRPEIAVRSALGAGRWRVARQLLVESLILALAGGLVGVLLAAWGVRALEAVLPRDLPRASGVSLDTAVLGFSLAVSLVTGVVFGVVPAVNVSGGDPSGFLKGARRDGGDGSARTRFRSVLVAVEVALALILLAGAGLAIRSFDRLTRVEPGFAASHLLVASLSLPEAKYPDAAAVASFYRALVEAVSTQPGVDAAGAVMMAPLTRSSFSSTLSLAGRDPADEERAQVRAATPGYFEAIRVPPRRGRLFTHADRSGGAPVAIVSETAARQFWPGEDPIGKRLRLHVSIAAREVEREVIGVVGDVRIRTLEAAAPAVVYVPHAQYPSEMMTVFVRSAAEPMSLLPMLKGQVQTLDRNLALTRIGTGEGLVSASVAQPRFRMLLLGLFATIALLLAAIGLYGVMAFSVNQRVGEIGLRMALGADRRTVMRLVFMQGMLPVAAGLGVGLSGAAALRRVMTGLLYEVSPFDPLTVVLVSILLSLVAVAAIYLPARRATTVDPLVALRHQ